MFISELLLEAIESKHASFCFGRMNPPTIGHKQLINAVASASKGGDYFVFVSQTQDAKKNPLDYETKTKFLKELFPDQANHIVHAPELKTIMQVAEWLYNKGYNSVTFVAGSDRLPEFEKLLGAYNGMEGKNIYYKFDSINYASSGERDPDAEGVTGVSASAAREAAVEGNEEKFAQITGAGQHASALYQAVRQGMGLGEEEFAEGWKGALAGAALVGAVGAGMVASNPMTIGDVTYQSAIRFPDADEGRNKQIITHNGKKYMVWQGQGPKLSNRSMFFKEINPVYPKGTPEKQQKANKPYELEPTDLWVNEATVKYVKSKKESIQEDINALTAYIANKNNGGGNGMLAIIADLKKEIATLNEVFNSNTPNSELNVTLDKIIKHQVLANLRQGYRIQHNRDDLFTISAIGSNEFPTMRKVSGDTVKEFLKNNANKN